MDNRRWQSPGLAIGMIAIAFSTACVEAGPPCGDGMCSGDMVCDTSHVLCVYPEQLRDCRGKDDDAACDLRDGRVGACHAEVCLAEVCGDGFAVGGEQCDDLDLNGIVLCVQADDRYCGTSTLSCTDQCRYDLSQCQVCAPPPATCEEEMLAEKLAQMEQGAKDWRIDMTMHRTIDLVTYSVGQLRFSESGFTGTANQLFSDRFRDGQPFASNQADELDVTLSPTGSLHLTYRTWNFDTTWQLTCQGPFLSAYLPDHGIVTLAFRALVPAAAAPGAERRRD